jgi:prepilin-type N-terminal cleavage/methylation domain-containing protein
MPKDQQGFTLIELIVVISIMVTLTSMFLLNYGDLGKKRAVTLAKNNVVSDLRKMQSFALSSRDIRTGVLAGDYGVSFSTATPSAYNLIADDNQGNRQPIIITNHVPATAVLYQIQVLRPDGSVVFPTYVEILFKATYDRTLTTYPGNGLTGIKETDDRITLVFISTSDNSVTSTVIVNGTTGNINQ